MKNNDKTLKEYIEIPEIFTEISDGYLFQGKNVITADELKENDTVLVSSRKNKEVRRDVHKNFQKHRMKIGIENQSDIKYSMSVLALIKDGLDMERSIREYITDNETAGKRINPVSDGTKDMILYKPVTIIFYTGDAVWDGAVNVSELLDSKSDTDIRQGFRTSDYKFPLGIIDVKHMSDKEMKNYSGDVGILLRILNFYRDKSDIESLLDYLSDKTIKYRKTYEVLALLTGEKLFQQFAEGELEKKEEGERMCDFIDCIMEMGENKGILIGKSEGIAIGRRDGLKDGIIQGGIRMLVNLVKGNKITISDAAQQASMTEEEFIKEMNKSDF